MVENTNFKEMIFWIVFVLSAIFIGWYLLSLVEDLETQNDSIIFIKHTTDKSLKE